MDGTTPKSFFKIRTIAVTETFLAIGGLLLINLFFFNGDRFNSVSPHPFWFVVILISAQYGVWEGTFATLIASAAFLIGNVRPRGDGEFIYGYLLDIGSQPLLWLVTAIIIGSLRFRHIVERDQLRRALSQATEREETIALHYEQLRIIKETLEQRLVGQFHTAIDIYKAVKLLETQDPMRLLEGIQEFTRVLLSPRKFSIFILEGDMLAAYVKYAWDSPDEFPSVIAPSQRLYEEVIGAKRLVCISNADDEMILQHQGMLAGPLLSDDGRLLGMLKLEEIDYSDLHISTIENFRIVCTLIGNAYFQAQDYRTVSSNSLINPDNKLYSSQFFNLQTRYVGLLAARFNFDVTLLTITFIQGDGSTKDAYRAAVQHLKTTIEEKLRGIDQLFDYQLEQNTYRLLLPGTSKDHIEAITRKILDAFTMAQQEAGTHLKLSFAAEPLHRKNT